MTTIFVVVVIAIIGYLIFKSWAKSIPEKRLKKEIERLEMELGDITVEGLKKDLQESMLERKIRRLKVLYQQKDSDN